MVFEIAKEMAPAIFTPERLDRLAADLRAYRNGLWDADEKEARRYAHALYAVFQRRDRPPEHPFLIAICFAALQAVLMATSQAQEEGE